MRHDSLLAGPTPLSTPSIAGQRHPPEDKSAPSWAPPLRHGDADPAVPGRWFDPVRSSWPHGNTYRDSASDPPASQPAAAPRHSTASNPRRLVESLPIKSGWPDSSLPPKAV